MLEQLQELVDGEGTVGPPTICKSFCKSGIRRAPYTFRRAPYRFRGAPYRFRGAPYEFRRAPKVLLVAVRRDGGHLTFSADGLKTFAPSKYRLSRPLTETVENMAVAA